MKGGLGERWWGVGKHCPVLATQTGEDLGFMSFRRTVQIWRDERDSLLWGDMVGGALRRQAHSGMESSATSHAKGGDFPLFVRKF